MNHEESLLQIEVVKALQEQGIYFFSVPNEGGGKGAAVATMRMISMGMRPGAADMVLVMPEGRILFIELKTPDGKQSESQKKFECRVLSLGHLYYVCRSVSDVLGAVHDAKSRLYCKHE